MKKSFFRLTAAFLLIISLLCVPALASTEYGLIYDGTGDLGSDTLAYLGESTLPLVSESLEVELRVDVLTLGTYDTAAEAAPYIYDFYGYGWGEESRGVTLTIMMESSGAGYAMTPGNWCIYVGGSDESLTGGTLLETVTAAVEPYMADRAWNGDDMTMSATALTQATEAMLSSVTDYLLGGENEDAEAPMDAAPIAAEPEDVPAEASEEVSMDYVLDLAGLLSYEQWKPLERRAAALSAQYGCGIYAVAVADYADYGPSIEAVIEDVYHQLELGEGSGNDGIILMLSMAGRDFAVFAYGPLAGRAFTDYGLAQLEDVFLDDFAENNWSGGFSDYLEECGRYLALEASGKPVQSNPWGTVGLMVFLALLISLIICLVLKQKMKSVHRKAEANEYVAAGGLNLTQWQDLYTHTTETRRKIETKSSDSSSSSFSGSDGGSGRSGKF